MGDNEKKKFINFFSPSDCMGFLSALVGAIVGIYSYIKNPILSGFAIITSQFFLIIGFILLQYRM